MITRLLPWLLALCLAMLVTPAWAQEPNRAGLVIQYGDGTVETACIQFSEPELTGFELLERSGLPMTYDVQGGTRICSIRAEGCDFPAEECWCECAGVGGCAYWSYHQLQEDGTWQYAQLGAMAVSVKPGQVDGWRWGAGGANSAPPPREITFDSVCSPVELPVLPPTTVPAPIGATQSPDSPPTLAAATPVQDPSSEPEEPSGSTTDDGNERNVAATSGAATPPGAPTAELPTNYAIFALLALLMLGGVWWSRREP